MVRCCLENQSYGNRQHNTYLFPPVIGRNYKLANALKNALCIQETIVKQKLYYKDIRMTNNMKTMIKYLINETVNFLFLSVF